MSDNTNFAEFIQSERDSLTTRRRELLDQRNEIDRALNDIDRSFAAVDAYEQAKTGKAVKDTLAPRATRTRRGGRRQEIIEIISQHKKPDGTPIGLTRGELLEWMGVKGDKSGEASVSNALSAMQRAGQVVRQDGGRWAVVAAPLQAAAE